MLFYRKSETIKRIDIEDRECVRETPATVDFNQVSRGSSQSSPYLGGSRDMTCFSLHTSA